MVYELQWETLTGTFHALMYEAVEQRPTVITEGGTGVCLYFKLVLALEILERWTEKNIVLISLFNCLVRWQKHFDAFSYLKKRGMHTQFLEMVGHERKKKRFKLAYVSDKKPYHTVLCSINRTSFMHKQTQILYFPFGSLPLSLKVQRKGFILKWLFHWEPISQGYFEDEWWMNMSSAQLWKLNPPKCLNPLHPTLVSLSLPHSHSLHAARSFSSSSDTSLPLCQSASSAFHTGIIVYPSLRPSCTQALLLYLILQPFYLAAYEKNLIKKVVTMLLRKTRWAASLPT